MTDTTIKQESPLFGRAGADTALLTPPSPSTKRRWSDESQDSGEKRQRIDTGSSESIPAEEEADAEFRALVERAAAEAILQPNPSGNRLPVRQEEGVRSPSLAAESDDAETAGQLNGFTSDPHFWMRIMSLPILESLVGKAPAWQSLLIYLVAGLLTMYSLFKFSLPCKDLGEILLVLYRRGTQSLAKLILP